MFSGEKNAPTGVLESKGNHHWLLILEQGQCSCHQIQVFTEYGTIYKTAVVADF